MEPAEQVGAAGDAGAVEAMAEPEGNGPAAADPVLCLLAHIEAVGLVPPVLPDEYRYASLPLCVIDAVFSIGVRYGTTAATVARLSRAAGWPRVAPSREGRGPGSHRLSDLLALHEGLTPEESADLLYGNRQRTSSRSGILKAEAVRLFAQALVQAGIETFADLTTASLERARPLVMRLPGQASGIAFDYFRMLAGDDSLIKPDRMVLRFVAAALGTDKEPQPQEAARLVGLAAEVLRERGQSWSPLSLDHAIWRHQSGREPLEAAGTPAH